MEICSICNGNGISQNGWGRLFPCNDCDQTGYSIVDLEAEISEELYQALTQKSDEDFRAYGSF